MDNNFDFEGTSNFSTIDELSKLPNLEDIEVGKNITNQDSDEDIDAELEGRKPTKAPKKKITDDVSDEDKTASLIDKALEDLGKAPKDTDDKDDKTKIVITDGKTSVFQTLGEEFKEKGLLDLPDDFDGTEESFNKAFNDTINNRLEEQINNYVESLTDEGRALIEHLQNGGKVGDFVKTYADSVESLNPDNEDDRKQILTKFYAEVAGMPKEKVKAKVDKLVELGLDEDEAKDALDRLKQIEVQNKQTLAERERINREQEEAERVSTVNAVKEFIAKNDTIKGVLPLKEKKLKKEFEDYLLKPTVKLKDGRTVTKNVADAIAEQGNTEIILFNAYNRFKKYNTSDIEKVGATKATKTLAEKLAESTNLKRKNIDMDDIESGEDRKESVKSWEDAFSLSKRI